MHPKKRPPAPPGAGDQSGSDAPRRVVISLDNDAVDDPEVWSRAVEQLKRHGLVVDRELDVIGMVAGTVAASAVPRLAHTPHVLRVEDDERRETR